MHSDRTHVRRALGIGLLGAIILGVACGGGGKDPSGPSAGPPASIELAAGDNQQAVVGTLVATAPSVLIRDASGIPVPGAAVTFSADSGSGTPQPTVVTSDADGLATLTRWILGHSVGPQRVRAKVAGVPGDSVIFHATATVGPAASIAKVAGDSQQAVVTTGVAVLPTVESRDQYGNVVPGASILFTVVQGGGSLVGPATVTTGVNGRASVGGWVLGPGAQRNGLEAQVAGVITPVTFSALGLPGAAASLIKAGGDNRGALVGTITDTAPAVRVRDAHGNSVAGVTVNFTVLSGGGAITGGTSVSDSAGIARAGTWQVGVIYGPNYAQAATTNPAITPLTFTAYTLAGPPAVLAAEAGDSQSGAAGSRLPVPIAVRITDSYGNIITQPIRVAFTVLTGGGGMFGGSGNFVPSDTIFTSGNGVAMLSWVLGPLPGIQTLQVTTPDYPLAGSPVGFTAQATGKAWGGTLSNDWNNPGNWLPNGLPAPQDTVLIPASTITSPVLTGDVAVGGLRVEGGDLTIGGHTLAIGGVLDVTGGTLTMTDPSDQVIVGGDATFFGGDETGRLTAGALHIHGAFTQHGGPTFAASGTHQTILDGTGAQAVNLFGPGANNSHFQDLQVINGGGVLANYLYVTGRLTIGTPVAVSSTTYFLVGQVTTAAGSTLGGGYAFLNTDSLALSGGFAIGSTTITGGQFLPDLPYADLTISAPGPMTMTTPVHVANNLVVADGDLILNGHTLQATGITIGGSGSYLTMNSPADSVLAFGILFDGADSRGHLTAGSLTLTGGLAQSASFTPFSFAATGAHRTVFALSSTPQIVFATPGATASHFQTLELVGNGVGIDASSSLVALGPLVTSGAGAPVVHNGTLTVGGLDVNGLVVDNAHLISTGGTLTRFDNVTFQNFPGSAVQLTIDHPGAASATTFSGLVFTSTPTTGLYLDAVDADGIAPALSLILQSNLAPATAASHTRTTAGPGPTQAQVTWQ